MAAPSEATTLTSLFHDLLGERLAKIAADDPEMVARTLREGVGFIGRQQRETVQGDLKKFSTMHYRRICKEEAIPVLMGLPGVPANAVQRIDALMDTRPVWHVVVQGVDPPNHRRPVSIYFLQNLDELRDLAQGCLMLESDDPSAIDTAAENPQFREWCRQWYLQSEDFRHDRSVRYICRLPGCAILTQCIRNDFGDCVQRLLEGFSDKTAPQPWLVLAEPMRTLGRFKCNAFHEAAYQCAPSALDALIRYGNQHEPGWRAVLDSEGKSPLDIARDRLSRNCNNASACVARLSQEYPAEVGAPLPAPAAGDELAEHVLVVSWQDGEGNLLHREREVLAPEVSWGDLVAASQSPRFANHPHLRGLAPLVLVRKVAVTDADEAAIVAFFQTWRHAKSVGFIKGRFTHPEAPLRVCRAVTEMLNSNPCPAWTRLYILGPMRASVPREDEVGPEAFSAPNPQDLRDALLELAETIALRPQLPLWRLDPLPAVLLKEDRHVADLLGAATDVKLCANRVCAGDPVYRFFWKRLLTVHQRMLDRFMLLSDAGVQRIQEAMDPIAVRYILACVRLWLVAFRAIDETGRLLPPHRAGLLCELDGGLAGALWMARALPELRAGMRLEVQEELLAQLPKTAARLEAGEHEDVMARP